MSRPRIRPIEDKGGLPDKPDAKRLSYALDRLSEHCEQQSEISFRDMLTEAIDKYLKRRKR